MTDTLSPADRSKLMSKIGSGIRKNRMERVCHNILKGNRVRHHMQPAAPGHPDVVVFTERGDLYIHLNGCFWHGCPLHFRPPKTRRAFWVDHIVREERDRMAKLAAAPGRHLIVWEHDIRRGGFLEIVRTAVAAPWGG